MLSSSLEMYLTELLVIFVFKGFMVKVLLLDLPVHAVIEWCYSIKS